MTSAHQILQSILEHPTPEPLLEAARNALDEQREARLAFRKWLKPDVKAEFINGTIIMHSPAKRRHNQAIRFLLYLLDAYVSRGNLGELAVEKALVELDRSDVEPDLCFWTTEQAADFTEDMNVYPPPSLVVEVLSPSTAARDRGVKKRAYLAAGVEEYWIIDPVARTLEQMVLGKDKHGHPEYDLRYTFGTEETLTGVVLPGFVIPVKAIFDQAARNATVQTFHGS